MIAIAFAWTTPALVTGNKTCTRRDWKETHARRFRVGDLVAAYDRQPRHGGHWVATLRLTATPVFSSELPEEDWEREGFRWLSARGAKVGGHSPEVIWRAFRIGANAGEHWWVVRFSVESLTDFGLDLALRHGGTPLGAVRNVRVVGPKEDR